MITPQDYEELAEFGEAFMWRARERCPTRKAVSTRLDIGLVARLHCEGGAQGSWGVCSVASLLPVVRAR